MFEESKVWVLLFLTALLISLGYGSHYFNSVDDANLALHESQSKLKDMQEMLSLRKKDWVEREQGLAKIQVEADKTAKLLKLQESLDIRYRKADSELNYLVESATTSVEKVRGSAPGTELGDITLADGRTLRGVKIRKVEDSGISLMHADGIGLIPGELLPENLKEKYDLGPNAFQPLIQKAHTSLLAEKNAKDQAPVKPSSAPVAKPVGTDKLAFESKIKALRLKMSNIDSQISNYETMVLQYQKAAAGHQNLAATAQTRKTPSTRHTANANEALAQAAAIERQIGALRAERKNIVIEMEYAHRNR